MEELLSQLERLGFYQHEEPGMMSVLKSLSEKNSSPWLTEGQQQHIDLASAVEDDQTEIIEGVLWLHHPRPYNRLFAISREDFYECFPDWFEAMQPVLESRGVLIAAIDEYWTGKGDKGIILNHNMFLLCPGVLDQSHSLTKWNYSTAQALILINHLLAQATSDEQVYVVKELDEDTLYIAFLSSQMCQLISASPILETEKPKLVETFFSEVLKNPHNN
ncbi:hypothetical protein NIES2135_02300 [Leptolyngbya boryana NIES-2135]|uniref:Uncharacterized protein n=1 Tax=Leptolyngbya boryana NIES-2135 TaxID=1973484 RepID=A0A1Z4J9I2_LEPBY|nr:MULTISPECIES: hypothetical protein [Leptolyngbya]BAY53425.1 hypothetical protein NIES2135_02300 [Leptolyngbya boryana NIES-2135]MBD2366712.1 hypothetical protein [Leptolyngbya sp. FACHB-161]MBD2373274.1 hypothetical protein [Leptolyngbya sp. FACHB-238]MBD2397674.1 hypothetical protein [Leptolyngbya sp. FACHB-239]MBD2404818.1 hypothetical protein [Leptolyngbya sp. FACHB-402]